MPADVSWAVCHGGSAPVLKGRGQTRLPAPLSSANLGRLDLRIAVHETVLWRLDGRLHRLEREE
jgi:hypothetical protein